jgi:Ca-activated chloride channel homolog
MPLHPDTRNRTLIVAVLAGLVALAQTVGWPARAAQDPPLSQNPSQGQKQDQKQEKKNQDAYTIGVEVNLVAVPVTVRRSDGGFVKGLPQMSFRVLEDGEEQDILMFAQEAVPTRIAIVLDVSGSVRTEWGSIKYATKRFAEHLKPEDQFALVTFNTETRLKMDWGRLLDRIDPVLTSVYCKDNTSLWDAIWVVSGDVFKGIREKKAMIIMSDGLDNGSSVSYKEALEAAVRSEAAIYVVSKTAAVRQLMMSDPGFSSWYSGFSEDVFAQADMALRKLAFETGGRVLYPNSFGQLDNVYAEVDDELRNQYTIGYVSNNQVKDGGYRRIEVQVADPAAIVSARPGYYAPNQLPVRK